MSSEIKYVNLPLETLKIALSMTCHGYKNRTDQENDKYHALNIISNLIYEQESNESLWDNRELGADEEYVGCVDMDITLSE